MIRFGETTREQAEEFCAHVVAREPYRLRDLAERMRATGGPVEAMDASVDSLVPLWEWFVGYLLAGCPGVPGGDVVSAAPFPSDGSLDGDRDRRRGVACEGVQHYLRLVVQRLFGRAPWEVYVPSRLAARYEIHRLHLRSYGELGRLEGVLLRHGVLRTLPTVEHELAEERVPDLALDIEVGLFRPVGEVHVRGSVVRADVHVLPLLDEAFGTEDEHAAVAPHLQSVGGEPVAPEVAAGARVGHDRRIAEVVQPRMLRVGVVGDLAAHHRPVRGAGVVQDLLDLVRTDVAQDAAVLVLLEEPRRPGCRREAVRPEADHLHDASDRAGLDELGREHGRLDVDAFGVVDAVLAARAGYGFSRRGELLESREGCLVREVVLARVHDAQTQRAALGCHSGARDEADLGVVEHFVLAAGDLHLGELLRERRDLGGIRVIHPLQRGARAEQTVRHSVDVPVVQPDCGEGEGAGLDDRCRNRIRGVGAPEDAAHVFLSLRRARRAALTPDRTI